MLPKHYYFLSLVPGCEIIYKIIKYLTVKYHFFILWIKIDGRDDVSPRTEREEKLPNIVLGMAL